LTLIGEQPGNAIVALGMGVICAVVAYGRWRLVPLRRSEPALSPAV